MNRIPLCGIQCLREGFTLFYEYNVFQGQDIIGSAGVKQEGLYFSFQCRCKPKSDAIHIAMVENNGKKYDLGVCVPEQDGFTAYKRIAIKEFKDMEFKFCIKEKEEVHTAPVDADENKPFPYLQDLDGAHLDLTSGFPQICITDIKDQFQDQQGSGQSQEFQNQ